MNLGVFEYYTQVYIYTYVFLKLDSCGHYLLSLYRKSRSNIQLNFLFVVT